MSDVNVKFQQIPSAESDIQLPMGGVTPVWYRFFHTVWQQVASGTPSTTTLQGAHDTASDALAAANAASAAVVAERTRAQLAEGALQSEIITLNGQVATLQATVTALETTTTGLQSQINVINSRLAAAGIP